MLSGSRESLQPRSSPVVALIFAAGGGAYATTSLGPPSVAGWAVVSANGKIVRGSGAVKAKRTSKGRYKVTFNQAVNNCGYKATIGNADSKVPSVGDIGVASKGTKAVQVQTTNAKGKSANYSFHLAVVC